MFLASQLVWSGVMSDNMKPLLSTPLTRLKFTKNVQLPVSVQPNQAAPPLLADLSRRQLRPWLQTSSWIARFPSSRVLYPLPWIAPQPVLPSFTEEKIMNCNKPPARRRHLRGTSRYIWIMYKLLSTLQANDGTVKYLSGMADGSGRSV